MLTEVERAAFWPWLEEVIAMRGVSRLALAGALDADSTQRVNRYRGGLIPTLRVLEKIVSYLRVLPMLALWHAGYFRELLGAVDELIKGSATDADLRFLALLFAVRAFPRRDCVPTSMFGTEEDMLEQMAASVPGFERERVHLLDFDRLSHKRLPPLFKHAADALAYRDADPQTRRFAAAEYVNAWADEVDFEAATLIRSGFTTSLTADGLLEVKTTGNGKTVSRFFSDNPLAVWGKFMPPTRNVVTKIGDVDVATILQRAGQSGPTRPVRQRK